MAGELMLGIDSRTTKRAPVTIDDERGRRGEEQGPQFRGAGDFGRVDVQSTSRTGTTCLGRRRLDIVLIDDLAAISRNQITEHARIDRRPDEPDGTVGEHDVEAARMGRAGTIERRRSRRVKHELGVGLGPGHWLRRSRRP